MKNNDQIVGDDYDAGTISSPMSFVYSGDYWSPSAGTDDRDRYGFYWSLRSYNTMFSNALLFDTNARLLTNAYYTNRGVGFAVRSGSRCYKKQGKSPPVREGLIINWHLASFPLLQYNRPYQA